MRPGDAYEVYLNDQRTTPQDELLTEVYIPVE
jgi:effector-binding domain-containing protein